MKHLDRNFTTASGHPHFTLSFESSNIVRKVPTLSGELGHPAESFGYHHEHFTRPFRFPEAVSFSSLVAPVRTGCVGKFGNTEEFFSLPVPKRTRNFSCETWEYHHTRKEAAVIQEKTLPCEKLGAFERVWHRTTGLAHCVLMFAVPKMNGKYRLIIDPRKLNSHLRCESSQM